MGGTEETGRASAARGAFGSCGGGARDRYHSGVIGDDPGKTSGSGLAELAGQLLAVLDEFSADIAGQIRERVPFYAGDSIVSLEDLQLSSRANAEFVLHSMREDREADISAAQQTGRLRAEQGVPLPSVMTAFRVMFSRIWTRLVEQARSTGVVDSDVLVDAASDIWAVHDTFAEAMASAYRDAAMAQALRDERERSALVAALLEGRALEDATVWEIADLLRLPRHGPFVVVAAESPHIASEALPHVETGLRVRGIGSAWRLLPEMHIGVVRLPDERDRRQLADVLSGLAQQRVGISPPYRRLTETATALRLARIAVAAAAPGSSRVSFFDDHPLAVAAVSAPDAMRRVSQTVLGTVLDLPAEQSAVLLETLTAWLDNGGSAESAARQLYCHPNTIRQRLRKLESCTGRSLSDPRAAAELSLALQAALLLPEH
jgi:hypothetical protein